MQVKHLPPRNSIVRIRLKHNTFALIDAADFELVKPYHWRLRRSAHLSYAVGSKTVNNKRVYIRLHRLIANTAPGLECHHVNFDPLDCRRDNLENMLPAMHHCLTKLQTKFNHKRAL